MFTESLLRELRRDSDPRIGAWRHVDMSISRAISERERFTVLKTVRLLAQVARSARLAAAGLDAYYPISQNRIGLVRDLALLAPFRLLGRRLVLHLHGGALDRALATEPKPVAAALRWVTGGPATRGIVVTPSLRRCFEPLLPTGRIYVVPNPVDPPGWLGEGEPAPPLRVLFISTLVAWKGYRELVAAVRHLADEGEQITLEVAGDPYDEEDRRWITAQPEHPSVRFVGQLDGEAKWRALERSHVVALPAKRPEGQPLCLIEAMAAGSAVLATRQGGIAETVGDEAGVLLEGRSELEQELTGALRQFLREPGRVAELGKAGRARHAASHSRDRFLEAWLAAVRS